mgnify:CR=1 FL=1
MTTPSHQNEHAAEQFARKLTAHLSMANAELPYVVTERLRAARMQALSVRKRESSPLRVRQTEAASSLLGNADGTLSLGAPMQDNTPIWLRRLLTALPLVALAGALTFIGMDAALLTSELPPAAYTDPGFQQYLQATVSDTP